MLVNSKLLNKIAYAFMNLMTVDHIKFCIDMKNNILKIAYYSFEILYVLKYVLILYNMKHALK